MPPPNRWLFSPAKHLTIPHRTLKLHPLPEQTSIASRVQPKRHWEVSEGKLPAKHLKMDVVGIRYFSFWGPAYVQTRNDGQDHFLTTLDIYVPFSRFQTNNLDCGEKPHWVCLFEGVWFHMVSWFPAGEVEIRRRNTHEKMLFVAFPDTQSVAYNLRLAIFYGKCIGKIYHNPSYFRGASSLPTENPQNITPPKMGKHLPGGQATKRETHLPTAPQCFRCEICWFSESVYLPFWDL